MLDTRKTHGRRADSADVSLIRRGHSNRVIPREGADPVAGEKVSLHLVLNRLERHKGKGLCGAGQGQDHLIAVKHTITIGYAPLLGRVCASDPTRLLTIGSPWTKPTTETIWRRLRLSPQCQYARVKVIREVHCTRISSVNKCAGFPAPSCPGGSRP